VPALFAEVNKASSSRGVLKEDFNPVEIGQPYEKNGTACLSILTDKNTFREALRILRRFVKSWE
jgi:indole-3-glycerol phosphate synthase